MRILFPCYLLLFSLIPFEKANNKLMRKNKKVVNYTA